MSDRPGLNARAQELKQKLLLGRARTFPSTAKQQQHSDADMSESIEDLIRSISAQNPTAPANMAGGNAPGPPVATIPGLEMHLKTPAPMAPTAPMFPTTTEAFAPAQGEI